MRFTPPHGYLSIATGSGFSACAIGGAFGTAAIDATVNSQPALTLAPQISDTVVSAGLPEPTVPHSQKRAAPARVN